MRRPRLFGHRYVIAVVSASGSVASLTFCQFHRRSSAEHWRGLMAGAKGVRQSTSRYVVMDRGPWYAPHPPRAIP